jgi:malate dehydrogenase (oxaloacetate-decarboxylating)
MRVRIENRDIEIGEIVSAIRFVGGKANAFDIMKISGEQFADITVEASSVEHGEEIVALVSKLPGIKVIQTYDRTFFLHLGGKIRVENKTQLKTNADLSMAYTPGVARVCMAIHDDPEKVYTLTIKRNAVAVVTDGTAVLGLGDIGPKAAMPVMEGKAMLFKEFADIDAWPICLDTKSIDEIVRTVKAIAPGFGGINLEDISSPRCFEIEYLLQQELDIPVFHDDQHGTAVVVLAALLNSLKIVNKRPEDIKVVFSGVGAAGIACTKILLGAGVRNIIGCDRKGAIYEGRKSYMNHMKKWYASQTNPEKQHGTIHQCIRNADVFIGLSSPGVITPSDLRQMARDPIVFAMANPIPEIMPEEAASLVSVMATGRSDYPNQINNVLAFPGIFRGALDCRAQKINEEMKLAAAEAIASIVTAKDLRPDYIIPSVFNKGVVKSVAAAVMKAAQETGVARSERDMGSERI